jgi:glycine oxidase
MVMEQSARGCDVAIVGGGLIGLNTAYYLAQRGASVRVFERGEPARAASWAGAGMLAPYSERVEDAPLLELCARSLALYPMLARDLAEAGGVDINLQLDGIVRAAFDEGERAELTAHAAKLRARGVACELLGREAAILAEPALGSGVTGALVISAEGAVDNRRLGRALSAACANDGVKIVSNVRELRVECDVRRVLGVRSSLGFTPATHVVIAAGAWSAAVPGVPAEALPPVEPVKGQMLALAMPRGFLRRTTWVPGAYLVPRQDGRLLVGATVERAGFDERVTASGIAKLLNAALAAAPSLGDFAVTETWAGSRPGSPDGRPFIGPTAIDGLILATGHARNGILLAPITAQLIAEFVSTGDATPLAPWSIFRMRERTSRMQPA